MDLGSSPAGTDEQILNMGIMTESRSSGVMKLQAMVDKKITCIAKNYSVDDETKAGMQKLDGAMTATMHHEASHLHVCSVSPLKPALE